MASWLRILSSCAFAILNFAIVTAGSDLEAGKRAYRQQDYATALKEFSPLAEQGNAEAQLGLGKMLLLGQGVLRDPEQAVKWLTASALQGNAEAQFFLGSYYLLPHRDVAAGAKWLRLSAEQGNQDSQLLLGKAYLQGDKDLPRDLVQAEMWLRLAAKNNLGFYETELRTAEGQMSPPEIARGKALAEAWKRKHGPPPDEKSRAAGKAPS